MNYKNALLQYPIRKHSGFNDLGDLDDYDSDFVRDLMYMHDTISNNPVRDYDRENEFEVKQCCKFTLSALVYRLAPAIKEALNKVPRKHRDELKTLLSDAERNFDAAKTLMSAKKYHRALTSIETGFSYLHDSLDVMRKATRKTPPVKVFKPTYAGKKVVGDL